VQSVQRYIISELPSIARRAQNIYIHLYVVILKDDIFGIISILSIDTISVVSLNHDVYSILLFRNKFANLENCTSFA